MQVSTSNLLVSWVITYLWDLQPTYIYIYIGVIIHLLSTIDTPKKMMFFGKNISVQIWKCLISISSFRGVLQFETAYEPGSKLLVLGMVIQPLIGILIMGI